ncbi:GspE/PulE/PilB domain-containing protein [Anaeromyxobacter oryzae]|uniref:Type II secretion system protein GspE N-terminal domain-containing protein n=1 Tax=Anaeromyxobacter oryzae TaxID=2918170 RepID=A0ABM7WWW9_9BACT|nr:general secretion pathway protein GspE [Anaeromyxobacter oryzae]BDG03979.1 hypothetical protein AMOR_29750 [Anaeromyxobacter oryzae]
MTAAPKKRLGEILLESGIIDATQLQAALGHQRQWGVRIGQALVDLKLATEADIVEALAKKFGFEVARLDALEPYAFEQALKLVPREFATRNNVFPMGADTSSIRVAMSDPTNLAVVDELRFRTGRRVSVCIGGDREIAAALQLHYPTAGGAVEAIALDLDVDDLGGEPVLDAFGGGSNEAFEAFFGSGPALAPTAPAPARAPVRADPVEERTAGPAPATWAAPAPSPAPVRPEPVEARPARAPAAPVAPPAPVAAEEPPELTPYPFEAELQAELEGDAVLATDLAPADEPAEGDPSARPLTEAEREILDALDRLAGGAPAEPDIVKPAQAMAAMIRLLIRRGFVTEQEFLDELLRR